jgi:hypothetical protein
VVLLQGSRHWVLEKWLTEGKLECSARLGAFVMQYNSKLGEWVRRRAAKTAATTAATTNITAPSTPHPPSPPPHRSATPPPPPPPPPRAISAASDIPVANTKKRKHEEAGAEYICTQEFQRLVAAQDIQGAAKIASGSPHGLLRTLRTIQTFQKMSQQPSQAQPVMQYFFMLLENGSLNSVESTELARLFVEHDTSNRFEQWLIADKLECSEELGDIVVEHNSDMAHAIYLRAKVPEKVISYYMLHGEFDKIFQCAKHNDYRCDYMLWL